MADKRLPETDSMKNKARVVRAGTVKTTPPAKAERREERSWKTK